MLGNFSKVLMAHISFTAVLNNGGIGKGIGGIRKSTKRNLYLRFVTCKKQSCCKAKMLPGYTSLLKKLSNFPNTLTGTIFLLLYLPTEASGKASVTPGKASKRMIFTICNLLYDEKKYLDLFKALITAGLLFT